MRPKGKSEIELKTADNATRQKRPTQVGNPPCFIAFKIQIVSKNQKTKPISNQNFKFCSLKREKVKNKEGKKGTQIWESRSKNEDIKAEKRKSRI
jgi:hypothetical protein